MLIDLREEKKEFVLKLETHLVIMFSFMNNFESRLFRKKKLEVPKRRLPPLSFGKSASLPSGFGVDTRIKFSIEPPSTGENAYIQWVDAMKGVARLPLGIPEEFRKKVWLSLSDNYIHEIHVDWEKTVRFAFNDRCNPDDNKLGLQIVKDLHRTGCSSFSGRDNEEDRAVLKRVLLAYARWNKHVGYCQGFNVIAALLLDVFDRCEDQALKVMIYLIDHVLPDSYFANNLRALSVDMAVFRDLLQWKYPPLSRHLDNLQRTAQEEASGTIYEPPLTNVFTMQWFLTLFATCLPKKTVLRMWDSILLEGSEILLRAALVIWGKLAKRIMSAGSADEFYTLMGELSQDMVNGDAFSPEKLIKSIYSISPFPFPQLGELREKYTYNIRPFTGAGGNTVKKAPKTEAGIFGSDEDDLDDEDMEAIRCFTGIFHMQSLSASGKAKVAEQEGTGGSSCSSSDISVMGPGVYGTAVPTDLGSSAKSSAYMERMTTDLNALKKQYKKLRQRQTQAHIILTAANAQQRPISNSVAPTIESPTAMNHLFIGRNAVKKYRNRLVTEGPRIASLPRTTEENTELQPGLGRRSFSRSKSFDHPAAIGYLSRVKSQRNSNRANSVSQDTAATQQTCSEERIKESPKSSISKADKKDASENVPKNTHENTEQSFGSCHSDSPNSAEFKNDSSQSGSTDVDQMTSEDIVFTSPCHESKKVDKLSLENLQEESFNSELSACSLNETKDDQQLHNPTSDAFLPQTAMLNCLGNDSVCLSEKPTLCESKEEFVSNQGSPETSSADLSNCLPGKDAFCTLASNHSVFNDAFSTCDPLAMIQIPSPKHDPNSSLSDSDTNALSFDVSDLASASLSCEMVSPTSEVSDSASTPLDASLLNNISLESNCSNPESPAMSDEASSLASFFETNSESLKISGDDEKTPQSVSPLPSEQCWDMGSTISPLINMPNNRRPRSHSYSSKDTRSSIEKIGLEFNIARLNGNSLCNPNLMDCAGRVRRHSTKSEHSPKDPTTSDSLESLSSNTSEGNICNKVSIPKLSVRQSVSPTQAYLNQHCAINGMKLGLYKPSLLKAVNKKHKPSLQSMFSKS